MAVPAADVKSLFGKVLELPTPADRAAFLDQACGSNAGLRAEVEGLLQALEKAGNFLKAPTATGTVSFPPLAERPGTIIGPYKLLEQIGDGGMGIVFLAEQSEPVRRMVAVKILKPGMDSVQVIARFEAERQALALMDHPNIARILDAGTTESGRPYFVMELVKGTPITTFCDQNRLTQRERLELFVPVCQAIQHAHQKGIIHRDIKPSNVQVTIYDGKPVPKVIDFGIAKAIGGRLTEKTLFTSHGQIIGTLEYMSPEQATLDTLDVDTRSDVYSLGVLLYELLTGTTPLEKERLRQAAFGEILRLIREEEPPRPSNRLSASGGGLPMIAGYRKTESQKLPAMLRGDLDWIVMKGLEKDRARRYETASALAADVRRYLSEEPVEARPPSTSYRLQKFVKRHRGPVVAAAIVLLAVLAGIAGTTWGWIEALSQRDHAELARKDEADQRRLALANAAQAKVNEENAKQNEKLAKDNESKAEWRLYASHIASAQREWETGNAWLCSHYLNQCRPDFRNWEHDFVHTLSNQDQQTLRGHKDSVYGLAFSPDGNLLASAGRGHFDDDGKLVHPGEVKLWDAVSGQCVRTLTGHSGNVLSVAFSPDGKRLASASGASNSPGAPGNGSGQIKIWDAGSGKPLWTYQGRTTTDGGPFVEWFNSVAFSPDGTLLAGASSHYGGVRLWDVVSGKEVMTFKGHRNGGFACVAFGPDGKRLASAAWNEPVKVWDTATGKEIMTFQGRIGTIVRNIAYSPDGKRLAGAIRDEVKVWEADTGKEILNCKRHTDIGGVAFSPDGKRLASASTDQTVKVWDAATGQEIRTLRGHTAFVGSVAFSPDGKRLASAGGDRTVKLWDLAGEQGILTPKGRGREVVFTSNGELAAIVDRTSTLRVWDHTGQQVRTLLEDYIGGIDKLTFSRDGKRFAGAVDGGNAGISTVVKVWDAASGQGLLTLKGHTDHVSGVVFSRDGKRLATASWDGTVKVWDMATGQEILTFKEHTRNVSGVAFSPYGKRLASSSWDGTVKVWGAATGQEIVTFKGHTGMVDCVAFSPDGKHLASAGGSADKGKTPTREVKVWDAASGQELRTLKAHTQTVSDLAFSPDGKRLASTSWDSTKLWDVASGKKPLTLKGHTSVSFNPDGKRLASPSSDGTVKVWDAVTGKELLILKGKEVVFAPDGNLATIVDRASTLYVWDATNGQNVPTPLKDLSGMHKMAFSRDGKRLAGVFYRGVFPNSVMLGKLWDTGSGKELRTLSGIRGLGVQCMAFGPDGKLLACAGARSLRPGFGSHLIGQTFGSQTLGPAAGPLATLGPIVVAAEVEESAVLALGLGFGGGAPLDEGVTIQLWDTASGQPVLTLTGHKEAVQSVAFSKDGKRLASAGASSIGGPGFGPPGEVKLWDLTSGREVLSLKGHTRGVRSVAFSPDGKSLASASDDQTVKVWDPVSGKEFMTLRGHTSGVGSLSFSPDGKRLATESADQTVKLWDVASGQEVLTLKLPGVLSVAFSPDGKRLACEVNDRGRNTIIIWDASRSMKEIGQK